MEAVRPYTTQGMSSLKPVNFNYFLSVKNTVEEGLLENDHITLNTTIYYVTKELQIDNRKFIHEPTTIVLHKLSCKPWKKKKSTQPTENNKQQFLLWNTDLVIDGFHCDVIKLSQNSEVLRIFIYTRLKINKK